MKRAGLIHCAGLTAAQFKNFQRYDQLPFSEPEVGYGRFTLDDAFRMRLMQELIDAGSHTTYPTGLGPEFACNVVENAAGSLFCKKTAEADPAIWIGHAILFSETEDGEAGRSAAHYCGPLAGLEAWQEQKANSWADTYSISVTSRIFIVNATNAARFVLRRAVEMDMPEASAEE